MGRLRRKGRVENYANRLGSENPNGMPKGANSRCLLLELANHVFSRHDAPFFLRLIRSLTAAIVVRSVSFIAIPANNGAVVAMP